MTSFLNRQDSYQEYDYFPGDAYPGDHHSLRLRRLSSGRSIHNIPHYNPSLSDGGDSEDDNQGQPRELRSLPRHMAIKKAKLKSRGIQVPVLSKAEMWKQDKLKKLQKLQNKAREILFFLALWGKTLQKIGGNFGGGVQSYFLFLRFLVILNFVSFLLMAGFVIIPSLVFRQVGVSFMNSNSTGEEICTVYEPNPPGLVVFYDYFLNLLSGTGFMEYSFMFYGYYNNTMVEDRNFSYKIPLAYLFTAIFYFAFCLICIVTRMGSAARVAVATGGSTAVNYSMIVFTGWDYGCLGDTATKLKQKNLLYRLQVDLEEERLKKHAASLTLLQKFGLHSLRLLMFLLVLGLNIAAFFGIFYATRYSQAQQNQSAGIQALFYEYLPSVVISAGNFLVPLLCDQIAKVERYSPSITVIVALLRAVVLRFVSLGVLLFTLWDQITCKGKINDLKCMLCGYNYESYPCWETRVGQEMYKLTLFDLLINIALLVLVEFPRRMVVDNWSSKISQLVGRQEFVVSSSVLGLVYSQTVVWTGALFCPLLPLINTVKFVILFYCKKITLFSNCRPPQKTFRSTTSAFFFLVVLLLGWMLASVVLIYSIAVIRPSLGCGPFRFSDNMWSVVPKSLYSLPLVTQEFLFFLGSQAFTIPLFSLSSLVMFYVIALFSIYGKSVRLLRQQLKGESRDKQFLVKQIGELSQ
ncbi:transmembrane channel-like protein 4 [Oryzias melastigma]|uniref:Transmembrane channel-like protein n=1 Tax=Oryzias melastigma TaxID=30732 RepID=A0A3B3DD46_ORYME|nr:transmembrane channel-like protein 4 [Oryzias melastigma]